MGQQGSQFQYFTQIYNVLTVKLLIQPCNRSFKTDRLTDDKQTDKLYSLKHTWTVNILIWLKTTIIFSFGKISSHERFSIQATNHSFLYLSQVCKVDTEIIQKLIIIFLHRRISTVVYITCVYIQVIINLQICTDIQTQTEQHRQDSSATSLQLSA